MTEEPRCRYRNKILYYLSYITVEPIMVLYMMAFMTTNVVEQSFFVYKACTVNHGYNKTICEHINEKQYENITKEVQVSSETLQKKNNSSFSGEISEWTLDSPDFVPGDLNFFERLKNI